MRKIKAPEERREEILDTAERLFTTKGYNQTTIIDILSEIGIAKGTFYYYFKSKEEVMDAIIMRIVNADVTTAKAIAANPDLSSITKLFQILLAQKPQRGDGKDRMLDQFHQPNNAEMHQKSLILGILNMTPVLTKVIEEGIREKVMNTDYPQETVEFLIAAAQIIFDQGLFRWEPDETVKKARAFISIMEAALGAEEGSFDEMMKILV